ncbi:MAG TPA: hypothetical protein VIP28_04120, partial [Nocardioides sp.]
LLARGIAVLVDVVVALVAAFLTRRAGDLPAPAKSPANEPLGRHLCPPHGPPHHSSGPPA